MGFYFRRSVKVGPVRFNFSKNGVGWSVGNKFMRVGKSATGKKYVSGGAGGMYYRENLSSGRTSKSRTSSVNNPNNTTTPKLTATGLVLFIGLMPIFVSPLFGLLCGSWSVFFILLGIGVGILLLAFIVSSIKDSNKNKEYSSESSVEPFDIDLESDEPAIEKSDERIDQTAQNNNRGIEFENNGELDKAIECYEQNVALGYPARHSYDRLLVIFRKQKRIDDEIRICKLAVGLFPEDTSYLKRLKKLEGTEDPVVLPQTAIVAHPRIIYGDKFEEEILKLPEFDFYYKGKDNGEYYRNLWSQTKFEPIWKIQEHFKELIESAKSEEDYNNLAGAAAIYEQIVAEKYWMPAPYDSLIKIYSKAGLKEDEKRVLTLALEHFKDLKSRRLEYVQMLAKKYKAEAFLQERLDLGGKITYYNGVFELYNPFTILERWEKRLSKLE